MWGADSWQMGSQGRVGHLPDEAKMAIRNRRTRTRMSGGVGTGADPHGSFPATRLAFVIYFSQCHTRNSRAQS